MDKKQTLIAAADLLEKVAEALVSRETQVNQLQQKIAASQDLVKKANDSRAAVAGLAKQASAAVFDAGLINSPEAADELAVSLLDHASALEQLAKLAGVVDAVPAGRASQVKRASAARSEITADVAWDATVAQVNSHNF